MPVSPRISVIVPTLNEASLIRACLGRLGSLRDAGHEVVLADGGSRDGTLARAAGLHDRLVCCSAGRARQMNAGARAARGDILLFLHVDTNLPADAVGCVVGALARRGAVWGRFDVRLSGRRRAFRVIETLMNLRSRLSGIATGDQAIFCTREAFARVGGYPDLPLMEDLALSTKLRRLAAPECPRARVTTSSRRWGSSGIVATVLLMWRLRLAYWLGADPEWLARRYR